jgi:hypothetical protein
MQAVIGIGFVVAFVAANFVGIFVASVHRDGWHGLKAWWLS